MAKKLKIVEVVWFDSTGITSKWEHKDDIELLKPALVNSVGFLLQDEKDYVTLVQSDSGEQLMGRLTIPMACIDCINELGPG